MDELVKLWFYSVNTTGKLQTLNLCFFQKASFNNLQSIEMFPYIFIKPWKQLFH